jgi:Fur family ferric uptake transcriptional regulator
MFEPLCAVFRRKLKSMGQKYTPERAQILDTLIRIDDLFDADELQRTLKKEGFRVSKATIYRTIKLLLDAGIIQKALFDSEQAHYQLAWGRRPRDLVVRIDTQEVIPVDIPELLELRDKVCRRLGLSAAGHRFQIFATK